MALDRLIDAVKRTGNPTVAGLDPKLEYLPPSMVSRHLQEYGETLEGAAAAILEFNKGLIDALWDIVPAIKPQAAYYEILGWPGIRALAETIVYARAKGMFVITDGKRNDIGTTMEAYAAAHMGRVRVGEASCTPLRRGCADPSTDIWAATASARCWRFAVRRIPLFLCW